MGLESLDAAGEVKGNEAHAAASAFSMEFSEPPQAGASDDQVKLAQAGESPDKAEKAVEATGGKEFKFTELDKDGPLGFMVSAGYDSPSAHIGDVVNADKAWQEPYKRLTEIDGHRLVDRHDNAFSVARDELTRLPSAESGQIMKTAEKYLDPDMEITQEMEAEMSKYPRLHAACKTLHETAGNPNLAEARELQQKVRDNLDGGIDQRERYGRAASADHNRGKILANGMGMTATTTALSLEKYSLIRYRNGGWR